MKLEWLVIASKHMAVNMCQAFVHTARHGMEFGGDQLLLLLRFRNKFFFFCTFFLRNALKTLEKKNLSLQLELDVTFLVIDRSEVVTR